MSEQNAAITAKLPVKSLTNRQALSDAAEYWARRVMWVLVVITSLWDVAVTFDRHFPGPRRLLYAALGH